MNLIDILIWAVLIGFIVKGFLKGLVLQVCSLLGFLVGGWAAFSYYPYLAGASRHLIRLPSLVAVPLSFLLIFIVVGLLFYLLGHFLTVLSKIMLLGWVNRLGGVVLGFLEGAFILCMLLYLGTTKPVPNALKVAITRSRSAQGFILSGREIISGWENSAKTAKPSPAAK
ncbi:CvpA family protein [Geobacter argillaceus]|uniref:Membrane protein required for colicin V production n=1 Tax=Geobacter argillaceus TaxID=345631 RepID=A0A562WRY6_9BACT|nr:CvpA family protein [Geobacter argillaceus]TWJ33334.1 membrane protein required for colicin V production [Geobacter argillaceus]